MEWKYTQHKIFLKIMEFTIKYSINFENNKNLWSNFVKFNFLSIIAIIFNNIMPIIYWKLSHSIIIYSAVYL